MKENSKQVIKLFKESMINQKRKQKSSETFTKSEDLVTTIKTFKKENMIEGIDYGLVSNYRKPTLLKAGAEKLCILFGFSISIEVSNRLEDWETGTFAYEVKVALIQKESGRMEAEGLGSCNSKEVLFGDQEAYTVVNTVLNIAKKRALVDAILFALNASSIFTQDIEDLPTRKKTDSDLATERQLRAIFRIVAELDMSTELARGLMKERYAVDQSRRLTKVQASDFIQDLLCLQAAYHDVEKLNEEYQNE